MKFKFRRYYLYYLGRTAAFFVYLLPLKISLRLAHLIGMTAFLILKKYRDIAISNLGLAFSGTKDRRQIGRIARGVFSNLARNAVEFVNFPKINNGNISKFVRVENLDILDKALRNNKGVILITAHFGNWELIPVALALRGYRGYVVGRRIYFHKYDGYLNRLRSSHKAYIIYRDEGPKKILRVLRNNHIIGMLADQDVDSVDGVFVDFFGRPAYTPKGPALLAMVSGAALIPAFIIRERSGHVLVIEKPIELADTGDKDADVVTNTRRWSDVVESYVRRYPDHWVWMHRRWKTQKI